MSRTDLYSFVLTMPELKYKLFAQKICPICGGKMKSHLRKFYLDEVEFPGLSATSKEGYQWFQYYLCKECGHDFNISELCDSKGKNE
jgi:rRNA maturation endonuclease Nob1